MANVMTCIRRTLALGAAISPLLLSHAAQAQRAGENAVANSEDAFGTTVGTETTGIYNENDTRGLSPLKAGNARIDGIYFDPVANLSGRLRQSSGIRVGIAAIDYPFPAPTGIVDNQLRSVGDRFIGSLALTKTQYSGYLTELDFQIPLIKDQLGLEFGVGSARTVTGDGGVIPSAAISIKPVLRIGGGEISPFYAATLLHDVHAKPLFLTTGALVPPQPKLGLYLGQDWAKGEFWMTNTGVTARVPITSRLALRGGFFHSRNSRRRSYTELIAFSAPGSMARHRVIADPKQEIHSWSGEVQLALRLGGTEQLNHRVIAGFRARDRYTESGGSDSRDFGNFDIYTNYPEPEATFTFTNVNAGRVKQSSWLLGYQARLARVGQVNLGLQRARYRASFRDARSGIISTSRDDAWLYNAAVAVELAKGLEVFAGTQKGLEDSGAAPDNALNRNEQLPTTRSTQYEGGLRWNFGKHHLVVSAFQITRPYFSFDAANRYAELGDARYRGAEFSFAGQFDRLRLLAGAVAMKPEVTGPGRTAGLVGERPAGIPALYARADVQYRTDMLGGLTPTVTLIYTGRRALGSAPVAALSGRQMMLDPFVSLDLGLRHQFKIGQFPVSARTQVQNIFDNHGWKVIASNTLMPEEHRRLTISLAADF